MLGLFGKKSDHPMADIKSAQQMLEELPRSDALKALQELTGWIESMHGDQHIRLDNRFAVLRLLDDTARPYERKLLRDYFSTADLAKFQEGRLWTALHGYYSNLAQAYLDVMVSYRNGDKGAPALKPVQSLIVARGITALVGKLKFSAVHYSPAEPGIWGQLAEYYSQAESQRYLDEQIELYPGMGANLSVRHCFAGALLWWASGTGSFKPVQIHLAERLTTYLCHNLTVEAHPAADSLFSFDLTQAHPPLRYTGDALAHPNLRFIGLGRVQAQLESLVRVLEKGFVPEEVNLAGTYDAETVHEVAKRLATAWLSAPPVRRNVRRSVNVKLNVVKGFAGLIDRAGVGANQNDMEGVETWEADDISATGFRCSMEAGSAAWVKIGSLIGYRPENMERWGAGIVRRLRRDEHNKLDIGIEILANQVEGVTLGTNLGSIEVEYHPAMWLMTTGEEAEARVLTRPDTFPGNRSLQMRTEGRQYLLMPLDRTERGDDYDLLRCRMMEKEELAESEAG